MVLGKVLDLSFTEVGSLAELSPSEHSASFSIKLLVLLCAIPLVDELEGTVKSLSHSSSALSFADSK